MTAEFAAQPLLHDLVPTVAPPSSALSGRDGQIRATGVQGLFHADRRVLSQAVLRIDGHEPDSIGYAPAGPGAARFTGLLRHIPGPTPDPAVRVDRVRHVRPFAMTEEIRISSTATGPVPVAVTLDLASDNALVERVKGGTAEPPQDATRTRDGLAWPDGVTVDVGLCMFSAPRGREASASIQPAVPRPYRSRNRPARHAETGPPRRG